MPKIKILSVLFVVGLLSLAASAQNYNFNIGGLQYSSGPSAPGSCSPEGRQFFKNTATTGWSTCTGGVYVSNGGGGSVSSVSFTGGIISVATATSTPALTVAGTSGGIPFFNSATTWATSAALAANALVVGGGAGVAPSTSANLNFTSSAILTIANNSANYRMGVSGDANMSRVGPSSIAFGNGTLANTGAALSAASLALSGIMTASTSIAAGGFTAVGIGTATQVYNTPAVTQTASIGATTMLANPASDRSYRFNVTVGQLAQGTTCSVAGSVAVSLIYTDPITGNTYTYVVPMEISGSTSVPGSIPLSTSAPSVANVGNGVIQFRAKASTNIQFSTTYALGTCSSGQPSYNIYPDLEAL